MFFDININAEVVKSSNVFGQILNRMLKALLAQLDRASVF